MELSNRVVMILSAQVLRQTNKTVSEMLSQIQIIAISEAIQQVYHNN